MLFFIEKNIVSGSDLSFSGANLIKMILNKKKRIIEHHTGHCKFLPWKKLVQSGQDRKPAPVFFTKGILKS